MGLAEYHRKRDFARTPEPRGGSPSGTRAAARRFVVQKHAASHLHYDFRLELEGALKSWSVPKGPSLDPSVRRLAMATEDHPIEYAEFEGVIPAGQYGGGAVLIWDEGTWVPEADPHRGWRGGELIFELRGKKLKGRFRLVKDDGARDGRKWTLEKLADRHARGGKDVTETRPKSVVSGLAIEEIARAPSRIWRSNRSGRDLARIAAAIPGAKKAARMPKRIAPQLAKAAREVPEGDLWLHEMELDGPRTLVRVEGGEVAAPASIAPAIRDLDLGSAVLDGIVTVLLPDGTTRANAEGDPVYFAFDLLFLAGHDLRKAKLEDRKQALRAILAEHGDPRLRYSDHVVGSGPEFFAKACQHDLEGVVSKKRASKWQAGESASWVGVSCPAARGRGRIEIAGVELSNAGRVFYPADGITKEDVARYYESVAERIVREVEDRPLTLVRCEGHIGRCTYMKHSKVWGPAALRRVEIQEKAKRGEYLIAGDLAGVISLVQMDILEIHVWGARFRALEKPDRLVFDIDPGPEVAWPKVIGAAEQVREELAELDLESFVKTTGGKGLHVVVPLVPSASWDECFAFTRAIARKLVRADPKLYTASVPKTGRSAKILIDYLRNSRGNTAVAAYSTRAKPGAPVATPVAWEELAAADPRAFTLHTVPARRADPWKSMRRVKQRLTRTRLGSAA